MVDLAIFCEDLVLGKSKLYNVSCKLTVMGEAATDPKVPQPKEGNCETRFGVCISSFGASRPKDCDTQQEPVFYGDVLVTFRPETSSRNFAPKLLESCTSTTT